MGTHWGMRREPQLRAGGPGQCQQRLVSRIVGMGDGRLDAESAGKSAQHPAWLAEHAPENGGDG
eukprot:2182942-Alexandrium_andersonii.AAC.1